MRKRRMTGAVLAVVLSAVLGACAAMDSKKRIEPDFRMARLTGEAAYRERIALPPDAVLKVRIEDVSLQDAPAKLIAETNVESAGRQVPLPFAIAYDSGLIQQGRRYGVSARIEGGDGHLMWITDTFTPLPQGEVPVRLALVRVNP